MCLETLRKNYTALHMLDLNILAKLSTTPKHLQLGAAAIAAAAAAIYSNSSPNIYPFTSCTRIGVGTASRTCSKMFVSVPCVSCSLRRFPVERGNLVIDVHRATIVQRRLGREEQEPKLWNRALISFLFGDVYFPVLFVPHISGRWERRASHPLFGVLWI